MPGRSVTTYSMGCPKACVRARTGHTTNLVSELLGQSKAEFFSPGALDIGARSFFDVETVPHGMHSRIPASTH